MPSISRLYFCFLAIAVGCLLLTELAAASSSHHPRSHSRAPSRKQFTKPHTPEEAWTAKAAARPRNPANSANTQQIPHVDLKATPLNVTVAMLQLLPSPTGNQTENMLLAEAAIRAAVKEGADISLMPELWNVGYDAAFPSYDSSDQGPTFQWLRGAIKRDSNFVLYFVDLARELQTAIVVTYLEDQGNGLPPLNSMTLIDLTGVMVLNYSKVHTCDWTPLEGLTFAGEEFSVTPLFVPGKGNVSVGGMICHDREQPEAARILMVLGAEIILVPNACYFDSLRLNQLQTRALENSAGVAMTNYPAPMYNGYSAAFNGDGTATQLLVAPGAAGVYYATFDLLALRAARAVSIWGDAFRRPLMYGPLMTLQKQPAFQRENFYRVKLY
jgi:N-carbamoylputrescine amidase